LSNKGTHATAYSAGFVKVSRKTKSVLSVVRQHDG
jgi:hypothetical protein